MSGNNERLQGIGCVCESLPPDEYWVLMDEKQNFLGWYFGPRIMIQNPTYNKSITLSGNFHRLTVDDILLYTRMVRCGNCFERYSSDNQIFENVKVLMAKILDIEGFGVRN